MCVGKFCLLLSMCVADFMLCVCVCRCWSFLISACGRYLVGCGICKVSPWHPWQVHCDTMACFVGCLHLSGIHLHCWSLTFVACSLHLHGIHLHCGSLASFACSGLLHPYVMSLWFHHTHPWMHGTITHSPGCMAPPYTSLGAWHHHTLS